MKISDLLKEFLILGYTDKTTFPDEIIDREIDENMVLRVANKMFTIYYITSGTRIEIPADYIKVFSQFGSRYSNKIASYSKELDLDYELEEFILSFTYLSKSLLNLKDKKQFTACLERILVLGTSGFNDWMGRLYNTTFPPIEFISVNLIKNV